MVEKELIIQAFDKASRYGKEYGDFADCEEIDPIRDEFISNIEKLYNLKPNPVLENKNKCGLCESPKREDGLCSNLNCPLNEQEQML